MLTLKQKNTINLYLLIIGFVLALLPYVFVFPYYLESAEIGNAVMFNHPIIAISMVLGIIFIFIGVLSSLLTAFTNKNRINQNAKLPYIHRTTL